MQDTYSFSLAIILIQNLKDSIVKGIKKYSLLSLTAHNVEVKSFIFVVMKCWGFSVNATFADITYHLHLLLQVFVNNTWNVLYNYCLFNLSISLQAQSTPKMVHIYNDFRVSCIFARSSHERVYDSTYIPQRTV